MSSVAGSVSLICTLLILLGSFKINGESVNEQPVPQTLPRIQGGLEWSSDDELIVVGTDAGLALHNPNDLSDVRQIPLDGIRSMDTSSVDNQVALATADGRLQILDLRSGQPVFEVQAYEDGAQRSFLDWSPDAEWIALATLAQPAQIWNVDSQTLHAEIDNVEYGLHWNPLSDRIVGFASGVAFTGIWSREGELTGYLFSAGTYHLDWSSDGAFIVGGEREQLTLWSAETGEVAFSTEAISRPLSGTISAVAWRSDAKQFAIHTNRSEGLIDRSDVIQIWSATDFQIVNSLDAIEGIENVPNIMAWSNDSTRFAAVSGDGHLYVWDAETFELLSEYSGYMSLAG